MAAKVDEHPWSEEALFSKAILYVQEMQKHAADNWQFGLWAALSMKCLRERLCPTFLSPYWQTERIGAIFTTLLGTRLHQLSTSVKFVPASALSSEVLSILNEIVPARSGGYNETACGTNDLTGDPGGFIGR
jgi:hypothetical protein